MLSIGSECDSIHTYVEKKNSRNGSAREWSGFRMPEQPQIRNKHLLNNFERHRQSQQSNDVSAASDYIPRSHSALADARFKQGNMM
jgi:hypothetical protein